MRFDDFFIDTKLPKQLEKEELYYYFKKMKFGDKGARDIIIKHNIRFVIYKAKKFSNTSYDLKELVAIGMIGLIKSVDTFDINKGLQFSTYSAKCIHNEILMFLRKDHKYIHDISLNEPIMINKAGKELKVSDIICDKNSDFVSKYEENESYKVIRKVVNQLEERDKKIILKHFGFIDQPRSQKEIAEELGLCQSSVSKIIKRVLKEIKIELEELGIIEISKKYQKDFSRPL